MCLQPARKPMEETPKRTTKTSCLSLDSNKQSHFPCFIKVCRVYTKKGCVICASFRTCIIVCSPSTAKASTNFWRTAVLQDCYCLEGQLAKRWKGCKIHSICYSGHINASLCWIPMIHWNEDDFTQNTTYLCQEKPISFGDNNFFSELTEEKGNLYQKVIFHCASRNCSCQQSTRNINTTKNSVEHTKHVP